MVELLKHDYKFLLSNTRVALLLGFVTASLLRLLDTQFLLNHSLLVLMLICAGTNQTSGVLLNSLPQNKKEIVVSRYIFMALNSLFITLCFLGFGFLLDYSKYSIFFSGFNNILGFYYSNLIFIAVILPLSFMFSENGAVAAMMVGFMFLNPYMHLIYLNIVDYLLVWTFLIAIWVGSSLYASLSVFNEREFS